MLLLSGRHADSSEPVPYLAYLKTACCVSQADVNVWRQWHENMHECMSRLSRASILLRQFPVTLPFRAMRRLMIFTDDFGGQIGLIPPKGLQQELDKSQC